MTQFQTHQQPIWKNNRPQTFRTNQLLLSNRKLPWQRDQPSNQPGPSNQDKPHWPRSLQRTSTRHSRIKLPKIISNNKATRPNRSPSNQGPSNKCKVVRLDSREVKMSRPGAVPGEDIMDRAGV